MDRHQLAVLTVAGSDSGGNAGIQADIRAFHVFGLHACTVVTALTAQNPYGVRAVMTPEPAFVARQLDAVLEEYAIAAAKTGMLANAGGPVMNLYLLSAKSAVLGFLGTTAWLFFAINLFKLPFSIGLGLLTPFAFKVAVLCLPALFVGTFLGLRIARRMSFERFKQMVLVFTALASVNLLR